MKSRALRFAEKYCQACDQDDAVQESRLVIAPEVNGLKSVAAFSSWLFTLIKRICHTIERVMFRHDRLDDDLAVHLLSGKSDHELRIDLAAALESLPAEYLEVVLLRDFEKLSIAEIAERLTEQPGAIKTRIHLARGLVREYMLGPGAASKHRRTAWS